MKRLRVALILISLFSTSFLWGQTTDNTSGIQFQELSFDEALALAEKEDKLVFMDAFAVWCGPCKMLDRNTFPDEKVGEFFNERFISIKMDMEKGEGPELAKRYAVRAYPTLIVFHPNGKVAKKMLGYMTPEQLLIQMKEFD
ncbi:MAG: thioredoxin domain-containing protein [Brumimicrobium sp.]